MSKFTRLLIFCWGLGCLFSPLASLAESPSTYQIEIIVYSHITEAGLKSEYWPELPPTVLAPQEVELSEDQILADNHWRLKAVHQKLENNHYPILLHIAWQETANDLRKGKMIHLVGGQTYHHDQRQMDGAFTIFLQRYFNVHFNLRFLIPVDSIKDFNLQNIADSSHDTDFISFKINENLRMRSNELNYIDHPLYGVLIQITPLIMEAK